METTGRVRCPVLVGRSLETNALNAALEDVSHGRGSAVFVLGEAGSGKTRLLRNLEEPALARGLVVMDGAASRFASTVPFAPLAQAFRSNLRWRQLPVREMEPFASGLRLILPEWPAAPQAPDMNQAQLRLLAMEAAVQLLARLGAVRGALLALEDVHWADVDTLALLDHLAAAIDNLPALLVATLRTGEDARTEAAVEALAERGECRTIRLGRLDAADVGRMAEAILGHAVAGSLRDELSARSQGNPLLVEELLESADGALRAAGTDPTSEGVGATRVPRTIRVLVADKLARLGAEAWAVITAAAVSANLNAAHLSLMTGLEGERAARALRECLELGLIELEQGALAFRHVLVVDAIREALLPSERERLNSAAAAALASEHGDDPAFMDRRGGHLLLAGRRDEGTGLLLASGRWKLAAGSAAAAADTLRTALSAAPRPETRDECRSALAVALNSMGRWEESLTIDRAAETADGRSARLARMARAAAFCGRLEEADRLLTEAQVAGADETAALALGALLDLWRGRLREACDRAGRAAALAERAGDRGVACEALDVLGRAGDALGMRAEAANAFDRWAEVASGAGLTMGEVQARMERGNLDFMSGGPDTGLRSARDRAVRAGAYASHALADLSLVWWLGHRGRLEEAVELAEEALELCRRFHLDLGHHAAAAAGWARSRVDPTQGEPLLGSALELAPGDADVAIVVAWTRGDAALRVGDWERAADQYRQGVALMDANPSAVPPPVPFMLVCALAASGRPGEAEKALALARRSPALPRLYVNAQWLAVGEALAVRSATLLADASEAMRENSGYNRSVALVLGVVVIGGELAPLWLRDALREFEGAGAEVDAARCRRLMRQARIPVPRQRRDSQRRSAGGEVPLSRREAEVLDLIASGFTNPEIAARLFISVRTVESHVAALLRKHDVPGRPALIALAARAGRGV